QPLDPTTRAELKTQLTAARDFALRYPTVADASAAGYRLAGGFAPGSGAHYLSFCGLTGAGPFDPTKPPALIYDGTKPASQVIGLMYYGMGESAPEGFAGPNDHWHRHSNVCIKYGAGGRGALPGRPGRDGRAVLRRARQLVEDDGLHGPRV